MVDYLLFLSIVGQSGGFFSLLWRIVSRVTILLLIITEKSATVLCNSYNWTKYRKIKELQYNI